MSFEKDSEVLSSASDADLALPMARALKHTVLFAPEVIEAKKNMDKTLQDLQAESIACNTPMKGIITSTMPMELQVKTSFESTADGTFKLTEDIVVKVAGEVKVNLEGRKVEIGQEVNTNQKQINKLEG